MKIKYWRKYLEFLQRWSDWEWRKLYNEQLRNSYFFFWCS